jgi:tetratricopeptide (TPR) repeat protein
LVNWIITRITKISIYISSKPTIRGKTGFFITFRIYHKRYSLQLAEFMPIIYYSIMSIFRVPLVTAVLGALVLLSTLISCSTPGPESPGAPPGLPPKIAEPEPAPPREEPALPGILRQIAGLLEQGDFAGALALFDTLPPEEADTRGIRLLRASVLSSAGRTGEARDLVQAVLDESPEDPEALFVLAAIEGAEGKERERRLTLERLIKTSPGHVPALTALGDIALQARSFRTASSYYDRALEAEPANGEALVGKAGFYRYSRDPQNAEKLLNQAIKLYPQWAAPLSERARLYREAGYPNLALEDLEAARKLDGGNYWIAYDRGNALIDLNRKREALEEFERAVSLDPDNFLAYVFTAGIRDDLGDYEGAEKDYALLVQLRPEYYFAFEGLGMHKMRKHLWAEARDAFMEAYNRAPQDASYALLAALNWMRAGKINDPRQFLEAALRKVRRESQEWYLLRLYHDLAGDNDVALRVDREQNPDTKAKMLFYLASFYDVRGNRNLADRYYLRVREMERRAIPEWRLNEWVIAERNLAAY